MIKTYNEEHLANLINQATCRKDFYQKTPHHELTVGDVVLVREPNMKFSSFPLAIVIEAFRNTLNEVTHAIVYKGSTKEKIKRHVSQLKYLFSSRSREPISRSDTPRSVSPNTESGETQNLQNRPRRRAAQANINNRKRLIDDGLL